MLTPVLRLLSSPRRRRRLAWTVGVVFPLVALVAYMAMRPGRALVEIPAEGPSPPPVSEPGAPLEVTPAVRRQVGETVRRFVRAAVVREDVDAAWRLASPAMRGEITRARWNRGELPVQPYPARAFMAADWSLAYVYGKTLGIDVMIQPKLGSGEPVTLYTAELTASGSGRRRRFLVDNWLFFKTFGVPVAGERRPLPPRRERVASAEERKLYEDRPRIGRAWWLLPIFMVLALVLSLAGFGLWSMLRNRRAERRYRAGGS